MTQYPVPEPQRPPQSQEPYPYNPYPSQQYPAPQPYPSQPYPAQPYPPQPSPDMAQTYGSPQQGAHTSYTPGGPQAGGKSQSKNVLAQLWNALIRFFGKRGLMVAGGGLLASLAFLFLPYYSAYSGYFLAAEALEDKWWLELLLALAALGIVIVRQIVPRFKQQRLSALLMAGSGALGVVIHYWFLNGEISMDYWRFGSWAFVLGMALVAIGGLLSLA